MNSIGDRIRQIRKSKNLSQEKFGDRLGVGKTAIHKLESGENKLTDQMQKSICREYGVDYLWLTEGKGQMFLEMSRDDEVLKYTQDLLDDTDDEVANSIKNFIVSYYKMDDNSKSILRNLINELVDAEIKRREES